MALRICRYWTVSSAAGGLVDEEALRRRCPHVVTLTKNGLPNHDPEFWVLEPEHKGVFYIRNGWDSFSVRFTKFHFSDPDTAFHFRMRWS